jgi:hypothetical protein
MSTDTSSKVSRLYDLSGSQCFASQMNSTYSPTYTQSAINGLGALYFNGTNNRLYYDGNILTNTPYTVFVVEKKMSNFLNNYFMGGTTQSTNKAFLFGYRAAAGSEIGAFQFANDITYTSTQGDLTAVNIPRFHTVSLDTSKGRSYYLNGAVKSSDSSTSVILPNISTTNPGNDNLSNLTSALGSGYGGTYYNGYIGEVLVFNTALSTNDRYIVNQYLTQKWGVLSDTDGDGFTDDIDSSPLSNVGSIDLSTTNLNNLSTVAKSGLKVWLDASVTKSVQTLTNRVMGWQDLSSNFNKAKK